MKLDTMILAGKAPLRPTAHQDYSCTTILKPAKLELSSSPSSTIEISLCLLLHLCFVAMFLHYLHRHPSFCLNYSKHLQD